MISDSRNLNVKLHSAAGNGASCFFLLIFWSCVDFIATCGLQDDESILCKVQPVCVALLDYFHNKDFLQWLRTFTRQPVRQCFTTFLRALVPWGRSWNTIETLVKKVFVVIVTGCLVNVVSLMKSIPVWKSCFWTPYKRMWLMCEMQSHICQHVWMASAQAVVIFIWKCHLSLLSHCQDSHTPGLQQRVELLCQQLSEAEDRQKLSKREARYSTRFFSHISLKSFLSVVFPVLQNFYLHTS